MEFIKNYSKKPIRYKLTLSHFFVTVISVFILELLFISGYFYYLRSDLGAEWAGIWAATLADGMSIQYEAETPLKDIAEKYSNNFALVSLGEKNEPVNYPADAEWMIVITPEGKIIESSVIDRFKKNTYLTTGGLPGFSKKLIPEKRNDDEFLFEYMTYSHKTNGEAVFGQATIVNIKGDLAGWVYYGATEEARLLFIKEMFASYLGILVVASIVAIIISGGLCGIMAKSYSRRLIRLRDASVSIAEGNYSIIIPEKDGDEIDQVGEQFNNMAIQLQERIKELGNLVEKNALLAEEASSLSSMEERNRIARDLHDSIKQQLFGFTLSASAASKLLDKDVEKAKNIIDELNIQAQDIQLELDEVIQQLRPSSLKEKGLAEALKNFCQLWEKGTGITTLLTVSGKRESSLNTEYALYRIAQEALNNIKQHADAGQVKVFLEYDINWVYLSLEDNGIGFNHAETDSMLSSGIKGMQERTEEHDGCFEVISKKGTGTIVNVKIPG